ncbi:MAG TPA: TIM-barrel domain-containing protein [Polyangiaceae bacterium]|nr:TIM-barrel domain-containing protein [Polyangiaceae bacterium]
MRRAILFLTPLAWYACAPSPPVRSTFGVFTVTLAPDSANLSVAAPNGSLLDGLDASDAVGAPQSQNDDAPPMTGFAVRDVSASSTMLFGSFENVDAPNGPWRVARHAKWAGAAAPVELVGDDGSTLATLAFSATDDPSHLVVDVEPASGPERRFSWGFRCDAGDHFLGFGAQTWGADARGETIPIFTSEEGVHKDMTTDDPVGAWYIAGRRHSSYLPLPEFLSSRGFIALADTPRRSTFSMCGERSDVARMELEMPVKVHLFYGPAPADAIGRMTGVFGRPRVPPAFAFAPWNDAIFGSANVRAVAQTIRANGIPSSVVWTEDWRGGVWATDNPNHYALKEEWEVDRTLYPDFESVASDLHAAGFKWLVYFNSFVEQGSKAWPETQPNGWLIKKPDGTDYVFTDAKFQNASLLDLSNPDAVKWAVGKMQLAISEGADGWMGDYSEWLPLDATLTGGRGVDLHAAYPLLWQQAQRQALDTVGDGVDRLSFVRSGWLGSPPLVDVYWPGDQQTDFGVDDGLPTIVPVALGLSISGISTYGSDIAGYQDLNSPPSSKELFFRWTELGALSPVMRTHHGSFPKLNWSFQSDAETLAHWKRYAMLHIALAPYLRSLAQTAHDTGLAIMRPLAVQFPDDAAAWPIADEYMLGPSLLVAPVETAGATSRAVHLPSGTWFPWAGGAAMTGGDVNADAPLAEIPFYARAGAIVPTYPDGVMTLVTEPAPDRVVYAFAGDNGAFSEIDGVAYTLTSTGNASGAVPVTWNGSALAACATTPVAPCVVSDASSARAYVSGPGTLELQGVAKLDVAGAVTTANEQLVVRH